MSVTKYICVTLQSSLAEWLSAIGLNQYYQTLVQNGYDNMDFISDITLEDLKEIGITKLGYTTYTYILHILMFICIINIFFHDIPAEKIGIVGHQYIVFWMVVLSEGCMSWCAQSDILTNLTSKTYLIKQLHQLHFAIEHHEE